MSRLQKLRHNLTNWAQQAVDNVDKVGNGSTEQADDITGEVSQYCEHETSKWVDDRQEEGQDSSNLLDEELLGICRKE
jgi:hypothetical protein